MPQLSARRRFQTAALVGAVGGALLAWTSPGAAATYYVDGLNPGCSDAGPGSQATPYCTISAAVADVQGPGATIEVAPGVYPEQVSISATGTAQDPFVVRASGSPVVIDGADDFGSSGSWVSYAGDVWLAAGVTWSPAQVFADGARLEASEVATAQLPAGSFRFVAGDGLYLNVGGGNPGLHDIRVGRRLYGLRVSGASYVTIEGFDVRRTEDKGIYVRSGSDHVTVLANTVAMSNGYGIQTAGCTDVLIKSNVVSDNRNHGIGLTAGTSASTIEDNESFQNARVVNPGATGVYLSGSSNNVVQNNRLHDNEDSGLEIQTASGNVSRQNRSWNNGDHGYAELNSTGAIHVGDIAWNNVTEGIAFTGTSTSAQLHNCISVDNGVAVDRAELKIDTEATAGFDSDDNIIWKSLGGRLVEHNSVFYENLVDFTSATGLDARSFQADPLFADATNGNFRLSAGSPGIDAANSSVAEWPATDAEGHPRVDDPASPNSGLGPVPYADRGALEFSPPLQELPPVVIAPALVESDEGESLVVVVTASDPNGNPIDSLIATLTALPVGNAAVFVPAGDNRSGTLSWTPTAEDSGSYEVSFIAANALADTATTVLHIANVDRAPAVEAPASVSGSEGKELTVSVSATDPDGDAIGTLSADLSGLPAGNNAAFAPTGDNSSGTLTWTPAAGDSGTYLVRFVAANALSDSATTTIAIVLEIPADQIHWTILGQTSVAVSWRGTDQVIRYGLTTGYGQTVVADPPVPVPFSSSGPFWDAVITGLQEDTEYHYSIGNGPDHIFHTPPPRGLSDFEVCVEGDVGEGEFYSAMPGVQALIGVDAPDFCLVVGDLTYANAHGQVAVDDHFNDVMVWSTDAAYMPAWGNHEWDDPLYDDLRNYKGRFVLPNPQTSPYAPSLGCCGEDWYWFDYGNARFIAYPDNYGVGVLDDWTIAVTELMDEAQADPAIKFVVTFGHRPVYSSGHHPGWQSLKVVLDQLGATHSKYVLSVNGHSHNYERTYPQQGVVYVTAGIGGGDLQDDPDGSCRWLGGCPPPEWSAYRALHHGYLRLRFTDMAIVGEAICGPSDDKDDITCVLGSSFDEFTIPAYGQVDVGREEARLAFSAQLYPNPFRGRTTIAYTLPNEAHVLVGIYDIAGRSVARLVDGVRPAGAYQIPWSGESAAGTPLGSGVYFLRVRAGGHEAIRKVFLTR